LIAQFAARQKGVQPTGSDDEAVASGGGNGRTPITGIEAVNKQRSVTMNIGSLVNELQFFTKDGDRTDAELEEKILELLVRAVRDAEIAMN